MSDVVTNGGRKRQLPSWMMGVTTSGQLRKPTDKDDNISSSELQPVSQVLKLKRIPLAKRIEKEVTSCENDATNMDSSLPVKRETRKQKKKSKRQDLDDAVECETRNRQNKSRQLDLDDDDDAVDSEGGLRKKRTKKRFDGVGNRIKRSTAPRKCNQKYNEVGGEDIKASSPSEEDEELTMEDLMSIAEEYVKADKGQACQQPATTEPEPIQLPASQDFSRYEPGYVEAAQSSRVSPTRRTRPFSKSNNSKLNNQDNSATEAIVSSSILTGDPTQDMLDLFLGPLLKKPQTDERNFESVAEDITLDCEFRKQKRSEILGEEVGPLMKKKSSLKDKVAMFFD